jgi:hypothetical protein
MNKKINSVEDDVIVKGVDDVVRGIHCLCESFISENIDSIKCELEKNKVLISKDYSSVKVTKLKPNSCGVYVFYIVPEKEITTYEELVDLWNRENVSYSPKVIKSRFGERLEKGECSCFYVGKSENLANRISQHIDQKTKETTYGLKISEHKKINYDHTFYYSYFVVKETQSKSLQDGIQCLLVALEKQLRTELEPLIGKQ